MAGEVTRRHVSDPEWQLHKRFAVLEALGDNAVGEEWRCRDQIADTQHTVLLLRPELTGRVAALEHCYESFDSIARLGDPRIVPVDDIVAGDGRIALVSRSIPGISLRMVLSAQRSIAPRPAALLTAELCDTLATLHAAGLAHGGLTPSNVLLEPDADGGCDVRLLNAGIATLLSKYEQGDPADVSVHAAYRAPETDLDQPPEAASDVYAAGIMLYEALTGHPPFNAVEQAKVLELHRNSAPPLIPGLHDPLWLPIAACLDKNPRNRPQAAEVADLLHQAVCLAEAENNRLTLDTSKDGAPFVAAIPNRMPELPGRSTMAAEPTRKLSRARSRNHATHSGSRAQPPLWKRSRMFRVTIVLGIGAVLALSAGLFNRIADGAMNNAMTDKAQTVPVAGAAIGGPSAAGSTPASSSSSALGHSGSTGSATSVAGGAAGGSASSSASAQATDTTGSGGGATVGASTTATASSGCTAAYTPVTSWPGGFQGSITITNNSSHTVNGWTIFWTFPGDQVITQIWNATFTQSGERVTAWNLSYDATIQPGGAVSFGFNGTYSASVATPTSFTISGC